VRLWGAKRGSGGAERLLGGDSGGGVDADTARDGQIRSHSVTRSPHSSLRTTATATSTPSPDLCSSVAGAATHPSLALLSLRGGGERLHLVRGPGSFGQSAGERATLGCLRGSLRGHRALVILNRSSCKLVFPAEDEEAGRSMN
jgi:hypothetical protein